MTNNIAYGETIGIDKQNPTDAEGVEQYRVVVARLQRAFTYFTPYPAMLAGL
jgi:hypothetical protein